MCTDPGVQSTILNQRKMVNMKALWMTDIEATHLQLGKDHSLDEYSLVLTNVGSDVSVMASLKSVMGELFVPL